MFSQPISKNIFESKTHPHLHSQEFWRFDNRFWKFVFEFFLYYLFGQKFWFWQTFWKVVFLFLSEHGAEGFSALLLSIWTEIRFQPTFLKSFLRSPQLHSQKIGHLWTGFLNIHFLFAFSSCHTRTSFSLLTASQYLPLHLIATEIKKVKAFCAVLKFCLQLSLT